MSLVTDLFETQNIFTPLAEQLRPKKMEDVVGQDHLLGPGKPLYIAFKSGKPHSMILWGPPGTGKTTLAKLMALKFNSNFIALSAVLSGVKDIRDAIELAQVTLQQSNRHTILFVDEVHRFNKYQQDAFLPYVEKGLVTFVGATTENPSFEVNSALLSRSHVYVLKALSETDLSTLFKKAGESSLQGLNFSNDAKCLLIGFADGDARRLLNLLEQTKTAAETENIVNINLDYVRNMITYSPHNFDKGGDQFYDQISALHKSTRGSDPDAALYWMCRMLDGGADPIYIGRRLIRIATEDIGLADPRALQIALNSYEVYERLGSPEGELALAQAVLYLACAPKSNATYLAYNKARSLISDNKSYPVPNHLRNAPTGLMKKLDFGSEYRYAHDEAEAYSAGENYFPEDMPDVTLYMPTSRGFEEKISDKLANLRKLDKKIKR
jgi:putative ATPase